MREQEPRDKNLADINLPKHNFLDKLKRLSSRTYHIVHRIIEHIIYLDPNDPDRGKYDHSNRFGPTPGRWGNG